MRIVACLCIFLFTILYGLSLFSGQTHADFSPFGSTLAYKVPSSGDLSIRTAHNGAAAVVRIATATIDRSSIAFPSSRLMSDLLAGAKEITVVKDIEISVGHHESFVPYSVYAGLMDPDRAAVAFEDGEFVLTIQGGDGASSYFVRIYFNKEHVYRTRFYDGLTPTEPSEETNYWIRLTHPRRPLHKGKQGGAP